MLPHPLCHCPIRHFVKRLTDCGFTERQAEEHVALLNANLATKTDIEGIKADIAKVEARIEAVKANGCLRDDRPRRADRRPCQAAVATRADSSRRCVPTGQRMR